MNFALKFLTEEGRTKAKNTRRRMRWYAASIVVVAALSTYAISHYWVRANMSLLQQVYFSEYLNSAFRSILPGAHSHYTWLARTVMDSHTKKEIALAVQDHEIYPALDKEGHVQADANNRPLLLLKRDVERKRYYWAETDARDAEAYRWFRDTFYGGQGLLEIYRPAWLGGLVIFFFGATGLGALDLIAQRRYLKGEAIRGTRRLRPKEYAREHRRETGYGIKVYAQGRGK
jgi:hypothetical protein